MAKRRRLSSDDMLKHFNVDAADKQMIETLTGSKRYRQYDSYADSKGRAVKVRASKGYDIRLGQDWYAKLEAIRDGKQKS